MEESMLVPLWLEPLLSTAFFSVCRTHGDAPRSECNMYCLDCNGAAFCFYCRSSKHKDHRVIQIRRSSYHDVVRVSEIQKVLDINGVQTYVINSARVMFLNERPQPRTAKGVSHICEVCGRTLLDTFRYCSLGCKLVGIKTKGDSTFILDDKIEENEGISRREGELRESSQQHDISLPMTPSPPTNSRRRKGIPHRAPFGT
ncbi:hypothetical protein GIB67_005746 [Kingdonia uniflora]|uniref:PLATZ transcription factor family protein n=1 Tax=Kingdonia uniflora TaxID=39325 RepID=A0A7J7KVM3_9MAGN|nr:hypothetical protein GIB67_005746 [Kingdonia uniflora]